MATIIFECDVDIDVGKILKKPRLNPIGEDIYLKPNGSVERDEDKIISAQRIFKENYYKAGGPWDLKTREKYT
jgi:hypothetical protein